MKRSPQLHEGIFKASELRRTGKAAWCRQCSGWLVPVNTTDGKCTTQRCPGCGVTKDLRRENVQ